MPRFETPGPIAVSVRIGVGDVRITATDRVDTVADVRPTDENSPGDVAAADATRIDFLDGTLTIQSPKTWRQYLPRGGRESIDVVIELPVGSQVDIDAGVAPVACLGRLGDCRCKTGAGDVRVDEAGVARLRTGYGDVTVGRVGGPSSLSTGSGAVHVTAIDGTATVKSSNGDVWIGLAGDDLHVTSANGSVDVDRALAGVMAKSAMGDVRLDEVAHGTIVARTACGSIDIGVRDGVAAFLALDTGFGKVSSALEAAEPPEPGIETVEVRAHSGYGDVRIRRSVAGATNSDHA